MSCVPRAQPCAIAVMHFTRPCADASVAAARNARGGSMRARTICAAAARCWSTSFSSTACSHVFCVPGESYLAALDAFHDRDIPVTVCRQEGGAVMMAEAHRQAHRPARHRLRDARSRRHQRLARPAHRQAGFLADDHVRRPGRARDARARGVSGAGLPRGVRHDGQMGDRNRRSGAHPRDRVARVSCRDERPSRSGGDRAARRHADGARLGRRRARGRPDRDLARPHRHVASAEDALGGREAADDPRRQPLVGSRVRRDRFASRSASTFR